MSAHSFNPHEPHDLIVSPQLNVAVKLQRFAEAGPDRIYFLFDFDRTLTTSKHTGDNTTTWQILHALLPAEGQRISDAIRDKYLDLEDKGLMTLEDSHTFSASVLDLHTIHGTNRKDMAAAAKTVRLRDGSKALFDACENAYIPTIILSAGIRDIIELIAREHDIHPTMLLSVKLQFDDEGRIVGWDKDSMVLTNNKNESVKQWVSHISSARPFVVLIGDTLEDARMVDGDDNVLRIRVCDRKECDSRDPQYLAQTFAAGYDMIVEEDLDPLVALTQWLAKSE